MNILVYGAGAIGSAVGERLSSKHDVTLLCRDAHAKAVNKSGLKVTDSAGQRSTKIKCVTSLNEFEAPDVVLITTKAYDTKQACEEIANFTDSDTIVVSIQNGLGNYEHVRHKFGRRGVVGTTSMGVTFLRPGEIISVGDGPVSFGPYGDAAEKISEIFSESGFKASVSRRIFVDIWTKAVVNAAINPVTVIAGRQNSCILHEPYKSIAKEACIEASAVAGIEGVVIENPWETVKEVAERTSLNKSSMLQDIEKGKKTEIREITGEIVRRGKGLGIPTPINTALLELLISIEKGNTNF